VASTSLSQENTSNSIVWKSYNELNNIWFEDEFLIKEGAKKLK